MFGKIFGQIFDSSIACSPALRHFFMDMIVLADADGDVDMTPESIAARTRIPLDQVNSHIACLCSPDPRSRTPDNEGRRLELLDSHRDWGWHIINYRKFREIASNEQRKASQRARVSRFRAKQKDGCNGDVTPSNACNAMQKQKQREMYSTEVASLPRPRFIKPTIEEIKLQCAKIGLSDQDGDRFLNYYESNGWRVGRNPMKSWVHALTNWKNHNQTFSLNGKSYQPPERESSMLRELRNMKV